MADDFSQIYEQYFAGVYRYACSLCRNADLAGEITQETFFKALKNISNFRGESQVFVWLCQIAKNTWISLERKRSRARELTGQEEAPEWETKLEDAQTAWEIHRRLHELEEPYKEVFALRAFGQLSFARIGELFGKSDNWARVTYYRAKVKIREGLE
ncbi:MAG: RNA polymerase sigma factor [Eubacteriales bacterium]|nr:RNA polymerase sigma factor [Eubacteriales bacterium]